GRELQSGSVKLQSESGKDPSLPSTLSPPTLPLSHSPTLPLSHALRWQPDEVRTESTNCNGCGNCRTDVPAQRMCPLFRATHSEAASPRAKANLMRYLFQEETDSRLLSSDDVRGVADLCV